MNQASTLTPAAVAGGALPSRTDADARLGPSQRSDAPDAHEPQSHTLPAQGERQRRVPRGPHERDESADAQAYPGGLVGSSQAMVEAARKDVEQGHLDTSKGLETDAAYERLREGEATRDRS